MLYEILDAHVDGDMVSLDKRRQSVGPGSKYYYLFDVVLPGFSFSFLSFLSTEKSLVPCEALPSLGSDVWICRPAFLVCNHPSKERLDLSCRLIANKLSLKAVRREYMSKRFMGH